MDIPSLSMALSQNKLLSDVGTAVLAKSLDQSELIGDTMSSMLQSSATASEMELSVNPGIGANIDIYA